MAEEMSAYVTGSAAPASKPYRENGRPKGMLPLSWIGRPVRVDYTDADGAGQSAKATLLDSYPAGLIFAMNGGCRTLIMWERLCLMELVD